MNVARRRVEQVEFELGEDVGPPVHMQMDRPEDTVLNGLINYLLAHPWKTGRQADIGK